MQKHLKIMLALETKFLYSKRHRVIGTQNQKDIEMKTIKVVVFATQQNTMCQSPEEFTALVENFKEEFEFNYANKLSNRCGSDGESVQAVVDYEVRNQSFNDSEDFYVAIHDNTGCMKAMEIDEWQNAIATIIDEFEYRA